MPGLPPKLVSETHVEWRWPEEGLSVFERSWWCCFTHTGSGLCHGVVECHGSHGVPFVVVEAVLLIVAVFVDFQWLVM